MSNSGCNPDLSITGYSTALFSTWYFIDEMSILFDCGDGATSGLLQKSRKVKHVFISHADRDHIAGLIQFNQLNARAGLKIYYPADSGSFPALASFSEKFDPHVGGTKWIPIEADSEFRIREDLSVRPIPNVHIDPKLGSKSFGYLVESISRKLKPEMLGKKGTEIAAIRKEKGEQAISDISRKRKLFYSGDTPIEFDGRYDNTEILIHEATFLTASEIDPDNPHRNKHSSLDQVMKMVAGSNIQHLVLGHFSSRYNDEEIDEAIQKEARRQKIQIPVYRLLPGKMVRDVLGGGPQFENLESL